LKGEGGTQTYYMPPGMVRAAGFKNRTHYFDSRKGVRVHVENAMHEATGEEPAESGSPEVIEEPEEPVGGDIEATGEKPAESGSPEVIEEPEEPVGGDIED
jgi:hypothetical protein